MSSRNFPPSFWNSQHYSGAGGGHHGTSAADLYSEHYHPGDAWYQYSQHHRAVHDYHHHNMAAQYGGLLLPGSRLHMSSHAPCKAMDWQHPSIESPYSSYPTMSGNFYYFFNSVPNTNHVLKFFNLNTLFLTTPLALYRPCLGGPSAKNILWTLITRARYCSFFFLILLSTSVLVIFFVQGIS